MNVNIVNDLERAFGSLQAIPANRATQLIELLERAPTAALKVIAARRIKFCWMIAQRILRDRSAAN